MTDITVNKSAEQNKASWFWQEPEPTHTYDFAILADANLTVSKDGSPVLVVQMDASNFNHLTFEPTDSGIDLIAIFGDTSMLDEGAYDYTISVKSGIDSREVEDSGTLLVMP
jgi:hypothetical protein